MGPAYHKLRSFFILQSPIKKEEKGSGKEEGAKSYTQDWSHSIAESRLRHECGPERIIHIEDFAICAAPSGNLNQAQNEGSYVCLLGCIITIIITKN